MTKKFLHWTLMSALSVTLVTAQGRGPGRSGTPPTAAEMVQMKVEMLTRRLTLTDAQQKQATTIFTQAATETESARASLKTVVEAIQAAVKKNDVASINSQSITYGTLSGQLMASEEKAAAAFYAILTTEQKATFDQMGPGGFGMGMRGFGGPGGGGPRPMRAPRPPSQ